MDTVSKWHTLANWTDIYRQLYHVVGKVNFSAVIFYYVHILGIDERFIKYLLDELTLFELNSYFVRKLELEIWLCAGQHSLHFPSHLHHCLLISFYPKWKIFYGPNYLSQIRKDILYMQPHNNNTMNTILKCNPNCNKYLH